MGLGKHLLLITAATTVVVIGCAPSVAPQPQPQPQGVIAKPGCPDKCGDVDIPYPFGMGDDESCFYDRHFQINCTAVDETNGSAGRRAAHGDFNVTEIALVRGQIRMDTYVAYDCYNQSGGWLESYSFSEWLAKFSISSTENKFVTTGCDALSLFTGTRNGRNYSVGCTTSCGSPEDADNGACSGIGCCESALPKGVKELFVMAGSLDNYTNTRGDTGRCSSAFLVAKDSFDFTVASLTTPMDQLPRALPAVYEWYVGDRNCSAAAQSLLCGANSLCMDAPQGEGPGYRCNCSQGFSGNPYLPNGCQEGRLEGIEYAVHVGCVTGCAPLELVRIGTARAPASAAARPRSPLVSRTSTSRSGASTTTPTPRATPAGVALPSWWLKAPLPSRSPT